jgi:hypothetical protein
MNRYKLLKQESQWEILQANKMFMEDVSSEYKNTLKRFGLTSKAKAKNGKGWPL